MELLEYLNPIRRWWWLIVISVAIATVSAYFATRDLPPVYLARTTLLVGRALTRANPSEREFMLSQTLAYAYSQVALREPVYNATAAQLGVDVLPEYEASATPDGQFLEIRVTDTNPEWAQIVANELARQLILQSPSGSGPENSERQNFIQEQLNELQERITETNDEIKKANERLAQFSSASEIEAARAEVRALETRLETLQNNYANLLANTESGALNTLEVFEPAALPNRPIGPNTLLIIVVAAVCGFVLSTGAAYLIEFFDDTLRTADEVARLTPYPIVGYIGEMEREKNQVLNVADRPRSPLAEAFRSLRTNLEFASVDNPLRTILVTSAMPSDGKTSVAMNLALIIAQRGRRVVLLDADLRKPNVHRVLGIPNNEGLSDIFLGQVSVQDAMRLWRDGKLNAVTSGTMAPNPTELLGSRRMDQVLAELKELADVVIVDSPPFFVSDAWVLASKVDGLLFVVQPGYTRRSVVRSLVEQAKRVNANVIGMVINRLNRARMGDGRYSYLSYYYGGSDEKKRPASRTAPKVRLPLTSVFRRLQRAPESGTTGASSTMVESGSNGHIHSVEVVPPTSSEAPTNERSRLSLDLLYALSRELANQLDLRELMQRILQMTLDTVGATSGSMIVLNEKGDPLEGVLIYNGRTTVQTSAQLEDIVERGLAGWVIENRRPAVLENTHEDPRWLRRDWDAGDQTPRSAISVPLMNSERVVGVLTLVHPKANHFTRDDLSTLTAIAVGISFNTETNLN